MFWIKLVLAALIDYAKYTVSTSMTELPAPLILHCDGIRTQTQFPQKKQEPFHLYSVLDKTGYKRGEGDPYLL